MQFDKSQILDLLRDQGKTDAAAQADRELPQQVDTQRDSGLLARFGLTPQEVIGALAGGGGVSGVAGRLASALGQEDQHQERRDAESGRKDEGGGLGGLLGR